MRDRFLFDPAQVPIPDEGPIPGVMAPEGRPVHVEVGFGKDIWSLARAAETPDELYLGIEISKKKAASFCRKVARAGLRNVRALQGDVRPVLRERITPGGIASFTILFPDPWPKRRHWKHRWIQEETAALLVRALVPGGTIRTATDHDPYAEQIRASLAGAGLELRARAAEIPADHRSLFAARFERLGESVAWMEWRKR